MSQSYNFIEGELLFIDKPKNWTSFDVIKKLQSLTSYRKFGHAGTLDPLATGLLIICSGKLTKTIDQYQGMEKEYEAEFYLGGQTISFDSEFEAKNFQNPQHLTLEKVQETIDKNFLGYINQTPPIFSAVKKNGQPAYKSARLGKLIKLEPRIVKISKFQITSPFSIDFVKVDGQLCKLILVKAVINCSKGTYIRSLVNDLGNLLGVGGYLKELRRTKIGIFCVEEAEDFNNLIKNLET